MLKLMMCLIALSSSANGRPLAESLDYAYHIIILFGRALTWKEGLAFCLAHLPVIAIFLALPMDKWFAKWGLIEDTELKTADNNKAAA